MISAGDHDTEITFEAKTGQLAGGLFGGVMGGAGGSVGTNALVWAILRHSPLLGAAAAGAVVGSYLLARFIFTRVSRNLARQGQQMIDELSAELERPLLPASSVG